MKAYTEEDSVLASETLHPLCTKLITLQTTFYQQVCKTADADILIKQLDERRTEHKAIYTDTWNGIRREVGYNTYAIRARDLTQVCKDALDDYVQQNPSSGIAQNGGRLKQYYAKDLCESYDQAAAVKGKYDKMMSSLAGKSGGTFSPADLKHMYRSVEKMTLDGQDPMTDATVLDVVRVCLLVVFVVFQRCLLFVFSLLSSFRFFSLLSSGAWADRV
jgi:hypothetical protein